MLDEDETVSLEDWLASAEAEFELTCEAARLLELNEKEFAQQVRKLSPEEGRAKLREYAEIRDVLLTRHAGHLTLFGGVMSRLAIATERTFGPM